MEMHELLGLWLFYPSRLRRIAWKNYLFTLYTNWKGERFQEVMMKETLITLIWSELKSQQSQKQCQVLLASWCGPWKSYLLTDMHISFVQQCYSRKFNPITMTIEKYDWAALLVNEVGRSSVGWQQKWAVMRVLLFLPGIRRVRSDKFHKRPVYRNSSILCWVCREHSLVRSTSCSTAAWSTSPASPLVRLKPINTHPCPYL